MGSIQRMREGARELGYPEPKFEIDGFFTVTFLPMIRTDTKDRHQDGTKTALSGH